jgi:hypothetical protein
VAPSASVSAVGAVILTAPRFAAFLNNEDGHRESADRVCPPPPEQRVQRDARYRVTTVVPLVTHPTRNMYMVNQEALDSFLEGYDEYAEFLVAVELA